jgi:hypothetical protein
MKEVAIKLEIIHDLLTGAAPDFVGLGLDEDVPVTCMVAEVVPATAPVVC